MGKNLFDEAYFEGREGIYRWTAGGYENIGKFPHWHEMLRVIKKIKGNGKLLDVGCAYGFLLNAASAHFESHGIDVSKFAIKKSRARACKKVLVASAVKMPFKSGSFDVITVVDTLEHITKLTECIKDITRALKKGGIVFLQLPNPLYHHYFFGFFGLKDKTHVNDFWLKEWKAILSKHKLRVEKCFGIWVFASKKIRFFRKSERNASLFPEWWIVAKK